MRARCTDRALAAKRAETRAALERASRAALDAEITRRFSAAMFDIARQAAEEQQRAGWIAEQVQAEADRLLALKDEEIVNV